MLKLDLGAGATSPPGFTPMGALHGSSVFPLHHADGVASEIRASHVLEHFPHARIAEVLKDWVRVLRPGGKLKIAVPDFAKIAQGYLDGQELPTQSYVMGGQSDANDFHKTIFDDLALRKEMSNAGLVLLRRWESELPGDGAALPISLNIEGQKPFVSELKISAAMSVPRLGFMDNFFFAFEAFVPLKIKLRRMGGAFWGQALTRCLEKILEEDQPDAIITLDYDTCFGIKDVAQLIQLAMVHPEAHAIAPIQSSRHVEQALFTIKGEDGKNEKRVLVETLLGDLRKVDTAHFGLTLLRSDNLRALPRPWFHATPDADGRWDGPEKVDDDINFWNGWIAAGNSLYLANRIVVGHAELMVRYPGPDLQARYQPIREFVEKRRLPEDAWL